MSEQWNTLVFIAVSDLTLASASRGDLVCPGLRLLHRSLARTKKVFIKSYLKGSFNGLRISLYLCGRASLTFFLSFTTLWLLFLFGLSKAITAQTSNGIERETSKLENHKLEGHKLERCCPTSRPPNFLNSLSVHRMAFVSRSSFHKIQIPN